MQKMDKTYSKKQSLEEAEKSKLFPKDTPLGKRLEEAWILTCHAYGIDPLNPPKMEKKLFGIRKHKA